MCWGGQTLVVGDWVASARALTCLALRCGARRSGTCSGAAQGMAWHPASRQPYYKLGTPAGDPLLPSAAGAALMRACSSHDLVVRSPLAGVTTLAHLELYTLSGE